MAGGRPPAPANRAPAAPAAIDIPALSQPADWVVSGSTLVAKNAQGTSLWTSTFPIDLPPRFSFAARNDESGGASVAMLDAASPAGSAPSEAPRYRCGTCPPGRPVHFVKIPKPARPSSLKESSPPMSVDLSGDSQIIVRAGHMQDIADTIGGYVLYTLDAQLRPVSVGLSSNFEAACRAVAARGYVAPLPARPVIEEVRTVRWWDGSRFVDLRAPSVSSPEGTSR